MLNSRYIRFVFKVIFLSVAEPPAALSMASGSPLAKAGPDRSVALPVSRAYKTADKIASNALAGIDSQVRSVSLRIRSGSNKRTAAEGA